jgi:hypothetical protein
LNPALTSICSNSRPTNINAAVNSQAWAIRPYGGLAWGAQAETRERTPNGTQRAAHVSSGRS